MVRDLLFKLLEMSHFNTGIKITAFSVPHFVYLFLIFGTIFFLFRRYRNRSDEEKLKVMGFLVYAIMVSYFSDFFVQEFVYPDGINTEKLPFHICIVTAVLMPFAQFNRRCRWLLEPVTVMACLAPLMYLCYPASTGEGEPWCYQAVQTMFFHGAELAWGLLNLAFGFVKPEFKNVWKPGALLMANTLWAKLGNLMYGRNFFFLEADAFCMGLVEQGIIPRWLLMVINPVVYFLAVLALYSVCYLISTGGKGRYRVANLRCIPRT